MVTLTYSPDIAAYIDPNGELREKGIITVVDHNEPTIGGFRLSETDYEWQGGDVIFRHKDSGEFIKRLPRSSLEDVRRYYEKK